MKDFLNYLVNYFGGDPQTEIFFTIVLASVALLAFIFNIINLIKFGSSIRLTEEKAKIDTTFILIDKFDSKRFYQIQDKLNLPLNERFSIIKDPSIIEDYKKRLNTLEIKEEINYFIGYFDTVAVLYFNNKLNEELFYFELGERMVSLIVNFPDQIIELVKGDKKEVENILYWRQNFLKLAIKLMREKMRKESKFKKIFKDRYKIYKDILKV